MKNWFLAHPLCPHCYTNRKGRTNRKGHAGYRTPARPFRLHRWEVSAMRKPTAPSVGPSGTAPVGVFFRSFPQLHQHLADPKWDDGTERDLSTLSIFSQDGRWKLCLSDRDGGKIVFLSGSTLEEAFLALERGLEAGTLEWRDADQGVRGKRPGRR
jgi:hypothetical protein